MASTADGSLSAGIKAAAAGLGFHLCGIARARRLDDCEPLLRSWIDAGMNDNMAYLGREIGRRLDPPASSRSPVGYVTGLGYYVRNRAKRSGSTHSFEVYIRKRLSRSYK